MTFQRLSQIAHLDELADFSLFPFPYEMELALTNGSLDLSSTLKEVDHGTLADYRKMHPFFHHGYAERDDYTIKDLIKKSGSLPEPSSMEICSNRELVQHMLFSYHLSYANYVLGKNSDSSSQFPKRQCGISSRNIFLSLLHYGYMNAAFASAAIDHAYVILPFVFGYNAGSIVIDPTSDQLWDTHKVRNHVFLRLGAFWEYRSEYDSYRSNMFPRHVMNVGTLKKVFPCDVDDIQDKFLYRDGSRYLKKAFKNSFEMPVQSLPNLFIFQ
jgi:hypothetical protein